MYSAKQNNNTLIIKLLFQIMSNIKIKLFHQHTTTVKTLENPSIFISATIANTIYSVLSHHSSIYSYNQLYSVIKIRCKHEPNTDTPFYGIFTLQIPITGYSKAWKSLKIQHFQRFHTYQITLFALFHRTNHKTVYILSI